eukprot:s785_g22.t1
MLFGVGRPPDAVAEAPAGRSSQAPAFEALDMGKDGALFVARQLRKAGQSVDVFSEETKKVHKGFKYADRVNATRVAFVAPGEWEKGLVTIKDLRNFKEDDPKEVKQKDIPLEDLANFASYFQLPGAPAPTVAAPAATPAAMPATAAAPSKGPNGSSDLEATLADQPYLSGYTATAADRQLYEKMKADTGLMTIQKLGFQQLSHQHCIAAMVSSHRLLFAERAIELEIEVGDQCSACVCQNAVKPYWTEASSSFPCHIHWCLFVSSAIGKRTTFPPAKLLAPKECCATHIEAGLWSLSMPAPDREAWPLQPMDLTEKFEAVANCSDSPLKAAVGGDHLDHLAASEATTPAGSSKRAKGPGAASARGSCETGSLWQAIDSSQSQATDTPRGKRSGGRGAKRKPAAAPKVKAAASPKKPKEARGRGAVPAPKAKAKVKAKAAKAASKPLARPAAKAGRGRHGLRFSCDPILSLVVLWCKRLLTAAQSIISASCRKLLLQVGGCPKQWGATGFFDGLGVVG